MVTQYICSLVLTGLIWTIQLVHYPSFLLVGKDTFKAFENFHIKAISILVMPLMLLEIGTAFAFYFVQSDHTDLYTLSLVILVGIWLCTMLLSSPLHGKLNKGYDEDLIKKLIRTNWPRTILWSLRSLLLTYLLFYRN